VSAQRVARGEVVDVLRAAHERELCRWLLAAERLEVHRRAGYASLAETMALFRDLQRSIRRDLGAGGGGRDDDVLLLSIARRALGGPGEEGRASYQVAVSRCDVCRATRIDAGGETHVVE